MNDEISEINKIQNYYNSKESKAIDAMLKCQEQTVSNRTDEWTIKPYPKKLCRF